MWTPAEIRRLIAQLAGVALAIAGCVLLVQGVQATGRINISSTLLSGEIESASAGLFLLFLGVLLIALPIFWHSPSRQSSSAGQPEKSAVASGRALPSHLRLLFATAALLLLALVLLFGGELLYSKFGWASGSLLGIAGVLVGTVAFVVGIITVFEWATGPNTKPPNGKSSASGAQSAR